MADDLTTYLRLLAERLRAAGVSEDEVIEIVAQVGDHVTATGEDPVATFGPPAAYARQWYAPSWGRRLVRLVGACLGVTGGMAAFAAIFQGTSAGVPIHESTVFLWLIWLLGFAVLPWTIYPWIRRRAAVGDGPGWRQWQITVVSMIVMSIAFGLVAWLVGWSGDGVHATVPRWQLVVAAIVGLPGLVFAGGPRTTMPRAPGTTWRTTVIDRFRGRA